MTFELCMALHLERTNKDAERAGSHPEVTIAWLKMCKNWQMFGPVIIYSVHSAKN